MVIATLPAETRTVQPSTQPRALAPQNADSSELSTGMRIEIVRQLAKAAERRALAIAACRIPGLSPVANLKVAASFQKRAEVYRCKADLIETLSSFA